MAMPTSSASRQKKTRNAIGIPTGDGKSDAADPQSIRWPFPYPAHTKQLGKMTPFPSFPLLCKELC